MKFLSFETFKLGVDNLRLHKLRSLLTSLGIIFGVAAVICMLSISEGASADEMRRNASWTSSVGWSVEPGRRWKYRRAKPLSSR